MTTEHRAPGAEARGRARSLGPGLQEERRPRAAVTSGRRVGGSRPQTWVLAAARRPEAHCAGARRAELLQALRASPRPCSWGAGGGGRSCPSLPWLPLCRCCLPTVPSASPRTPSAFLSPGHLGGRGGPPRKPTVFNYTCEDLRQVGLDLCGGPRLASPRWSGALMRSETRQVEQKVGKGGRRSRGGSGRSRGRS